MNKSLLIFLFSLFSTLLFAQVEHGRYFEEIRGSAWQSTDLIISVNFNELKDFGLTSLDPSLDALPTNATIWSFNETLKIETFDTIKNELILLQECRYIQDKKSKTLKLFVEGKEFIFGYVSTSTGSYVGFTKKRK